MGQGVVPSPSVVVFVCLGFFGVCVCVCVLCVCVYVCLFTNEYKSELDENITVDNFLTNRAQTCLFRYSYLIFIAQTTAKVMC